MTVSAASPTLTVTAGATVVVGTTKMLTASAALAGGYSPTGYVVFTLTAPNRSTVDQAIVAVSGNGTYKTPSPGYLPKTPGTYQWTVSYNGDGNNTAPAVATGTEVVNAATTPTLTTKAGGTRVVGGTTKLTASATLAGGAKPTGFITFYLFAPGVTPNATDSNNVYSDNVKITGNGTYTTATATGNHAGGYLPSGSGTLTGAYQWVVIYGGDLKNNSYTAATRTEKVNLASPKLAATAGSPVVIGSGTKMTDSAVLSGGANPGGAILFTLTSPSGTIADSEIVTVTANGTYSTPNGYAPTIAGKYHWTASYSGDGNNNTVSAATTEQTSAAITPTLIGAVGRATAVASGGTLTDTVTLAGGSSPTGTITFYLFAPGVTPNATGSGSVFSDRVTVSGNGTYHTAPGYLSTLAGTYRWEAVYSGDNGNNPASTTDPETVNAPPAGSRWGR